MRKRGRIKALLAIVLMGSIGTCYASNTQNNMSAGDREIGEEKEVKFIDTDESWAEKYIEEVAEEKILLGVDEIHFCPKAYMTRGEFTGVLARMLKLNGEEYRDKYRDVKRTYYYADYIEQLSKLGILSGYEDGYYRPNKELTREEMISQLVRTYEYIKDGAVSYDSSAELRFTDSYQISEWALKDIKKAYELGFIEGDERNQLNPQSLVTREETAKLIVVFHT